jgi:hypothetical protein
VLQPYILTLVNVKITKLTFCPVNGPLNVHIGERTQPKLTLRLTHDTRPVNVTAKVTGCRVDYKLKETLFERLKEIKALRVPLTRRLFST